MKLHVGMFKTSEVRLITWMFTFVSVTLDDKYAIENLINSPDRRKV